ncbi:MAG: phenylalanine--tRNA ligase subunit beta [Candidatus Hadarchaeum sp.]|uniref:phenylalanine--tRNA ligase subunit beta n=1 Tax=Candidatus Hadarchaeum sp. TaxID=2883567 RepID=UPI003D0DFDAE
MPSISVRYQDLCSLLGKTIEIERLCERLSMLGIEAEAKGEEIKLEIAHNRPDLLSCEGVARALQGFLRIKTGLPKYKIRTSKITVEVEPSVEAVRPFIVAGVVKKVKMTDDIVASMMQVQEKLHASLGRKRDKASIGIYDLKTIAPKVIYTTTAPEGIRFLPLDFNRELTPAEILREHPKGIEYGWLLQGLPRFPLLIDEKGTVLSLPPIINSEDTRVTEKTDSLFIDVTGHDERTVNQVLNIIMTGLGERGFGLETVAIKYPKRWATTPDLRPRKLNLGVRNTNKTIGIEISPKQIAKLAMAMRYGVERVGKDSLKLLVPPYRCDIMHEIDIIEDIAIGYGYDNLKPTLPKVLTIGERAPIEKISGKARRVLTGLNFMEVMTYTLTNPKTNFDLMRRKGEAVEIANPISEEYTILRDSLIPSLLSVMRENRRNPLPQKIFEIGDVVLLDEESETGARNVRRAAAAVTGEGLGFTYMKAAAESLLRELGKQWEVRPSSHPSFIEGRVAEFRLRDKKIGAVGEIHPEVIVNFELENPVAVFEIDLE